MHTDKFHHVPNAERKSQNNTKLLVIGSDIVSSLDIYYLHEFLKNVIKSQLLQHLCTNLNPCQICGHRSISENLRVHLMQLLFITNYYVYIIMCIIILYIHRT